LHNGNHSIAGSRSDGRIGLARTKISAYIARLDHPEAEVQRMNELETKCVTAGLKMTEQRRVILQVLAEAADHPSVDTVYARARAVDPSVSIATVYRTLSLLDQLNLVQKHDFKASFSRFETNLRHHHHLIDIESGDVIEFQNDRLEALKREIAAELGYDLVDHTLELYGRKRKV
jgi:Fur family ferric uptake transcriptional regulator